VDVLDAARPQLHCGVQRARSGLELPQADLPATRQLQSTKP
jgi:hypothetical protein